MVTDKPPVDYGFRAVPYRDRKGQWAGIFYGPMPLGTRYVRDAAGVARVFGSEIDARRAAAEAMMRALNDRPRPTPKGKPAFVRRARVGGKWNVIMT